jgi:nitroimidazol reductase NimA-like FMN-containing flavoprotein (pyridoxamine 5'-phosphate oxidase superfamily)
MLGELNELQMDNLLVSQALGRIACINGDEPYIIPITYAYDGKNIIAQAREGMKLSLMRKNPNVCFQVDLVMNMANWQSVIAFGKFQELKGKAAIQARELLYNRVMPLTTSSTIHAHEHEVLDKVDDSHRHKPVVYVIKIRKKTGRYEKQ